MFQRRSLLDGELNPLLVDPVQEIGSGGNSFPDEIGCTIQHGVHTVREIAVPRLFKPSPIALNSIVFAVVGRVVDDADRNAGKVSKFDHAQQELTSTSATFRTVIHVDHQTFDIGKKVLSRTPPKEQPINKKVAGLVAASEKEGSLASQRFQDAAGDELVLRSHVMVPSLDRCEAARTSLS